MSVALIERRTAHGMSTWYKYLLRLPKERGGVKGAQYKMKYRTSMQRIMLFKFRVLIQNDNNLRISSPQYTTNVNRYYLGDKMWCKIATLVQLCEKKTQYNIYMFCCQFALSTTYSMWRIRLVLILLTYTPLNSIPLYMQVRYTVITTISTQEAATVRSRRRKNARSKISQLHWKLVNLIFKKADMWGLGFGWLPYILCNKIRSEVLVILCNTIW
jgi:hypothetical protein